MEIINNVNRVVKLPPGFRFHPTDEELVFHYLKRKLHSFPLPSSIIPELDAGKSDPWDLPAVGIGHSGKEIYFFSNREVKYPNGNRSNRATLSGYWKATGKDKPILQTAFKKTLVFYLGKPPNGQRTDWIMHEYRLQTTLPHHQAKGDWVLCKIFQKKRNNAVSKKDVEEKEEQKMVYGHDDDDKKEDRETNKKIGKAVLCDLNLPAPSCSSSSGSSALTQISSDNDDSGSSSCYNNSVSKKTY